MGSLVVLFRVLLSLINDEVIVGPVLLVGAGGADFHFLCGERVEEIRGAPLVEELFVFECLALRIEEDDTLWVFAEELFGDFCVLAADGVFFIGESVVADELIDHCKCFVRVDGLVECATGFDGRIVVHTPICEASKSGVVRLGYVVWIRRGGLARD